MAITHVRRIREVSWPAFIGLLVVTFVVFSVLSEKRATQHTVTGTVTEFHASAWMSVANDTTDPMGFPIAVRETTAYEGNRAAMKPGIRVTVWYRSVGERRFVADKVRLLNNAEDR